MIKIIITFLLILSFSLVYSQDSATVVIEKSISDEMKREDTTKARIRKDAEDEEKRNPTYRVDSLQRVEHEKLFTRKKIRRK